MVVGNFHHVCSKYNESSQGDKGMWPEHNPQIPCPVRLGLAVLVIPGARCVPSPTSEVH